MLGSPASHSQHSRPPYSQPQHSLWGSSDGIAYIHTTPLLQGKPVTDHRTQPHQSSPNRTRSPFQDPSVQLQSDHPHTDDQPPCQQQQQQQQQHYLGCQNQSQLPMILEQHSNQSLSPSETAQFSAGSPTTSSYSSPSASTAANTSSTDLRAFPDGVVDGPLHLPPLTPAYPLQASTPFLQGGQDFLDVSSSQQGGGGADFKLGTGGLNKSRFRGVSYDKKKRKWRVQIKVATLGKSGVSVGYYDTEDNAARAYDRAAIGLLGRDNCSITTNFPLGDYDEEVVPQLIGKSREEVKTTLKNERAKVPRRRFSSRQRTSRYMGVGSSNRKNQWQARILVHGKVTHLGYYETEEDAAKVYDRVSISLHGEAAQTNFPQGQYQGQDCREYSGLDREDLQRALGVKPMDKSSKFRGVSKKKGKWEAKVMVNRKWAYRELFDSEEEAARAYDGAVWRLKPKEAKSYVNFKERPGQGSSKLAKAARMIERAQAKERVGSSQNSPSSSRSLPPLAPAHEGGSDTAPPSYPLQQQGPQQGGQALQGFHVGIKLEPGTNFSHSATAWAAQSAAVANLGAAPPPAGSPGSLSRTSSSHVPGVGNPMGPPRSNPSPPAWLCQPLSTPMPFSPQRVYQLDGTPATPTGRGGVFGNQQLLPMPPALMQQHSLSMSRTLSEADISNQSAMSALTGSSVHHTTLPPAASVSRQTFQAQSPPMGANPHWSPVSPRKLRASMSYQDLSCQPFKQGLVSSPGFSSPSPAPLAPLHPQTHTQMPQHAQQHAQQQQQRGNMMVRVGSETHLLPETRGGYFRRVPSAPFMNLEQCGNSNGNSGGRQFVSLDPRLQVEESPSLAPFGQWAPDSSQVLGIKQQQEASDMQVDMPMVSQAFADDDAGVAHLSPRYMQAPQPGYQTPPSPSTLPPLPHHQHQQHRRMMSPQSCQQDSHMAPHMHQQHSHMSPRMLQPMQSQAVSPYCGPQQLSQQQQHQQQREHEQQLQQCEHDLQLQQHQQQFHQQQQEQQFQQQEQQQQMRQQRMFQLQEQLQRQQQQLQQQQQQGQGQGQMHAPGQGQDQGQGMSRSASVSHMNMQWQLPESFGRSASASNLMMQGQSWMSLASNQDGSRNQYGDPMMTDQQMRSSASGMQFGHHGSHTMDNSPFDPTSQPGDDRGLDSIDSHHQDLLADLSASQILAQADLAECNSPLKIVQIGGDDLFENDEAGANDFLLDPESGLP